jgi:hypothetical protein
VNIIAQRRLETRLTEQGRAAQAEVLAKHRGAMDRSNFTVRRIKWQLSLRVTPTGEPAFEVAYSQWLPPSYEPVVGQIFDVLYDPADRSQVVVDPRADSPLTKAMEIQQSAGPTAEEQRVAAQEFMALTNPAIAKVNAELEARLTASPPPVPDRLQPDIASRLEQLDRLMKAGLIDDNQYQAKRQKLLDQL